MATSLPLNKAHDKYDVTRWDKDTGGAARHNIATEVPVSLVYKGISHVVMMATPTELEDFALGFSLSENIIETPAQMLALDILESDHGLIISMDIPEQAHRKIANRRRYLAGRTGCGLCGVESLEEAMPQLRPVTATTEVQRAAIYKAFEGLHDRQPEKEATGAVHGAAWCSPQGDIIAVREDVGRHNALDKMIGAMAKNDTDFTNGFALITSRCSYEMVQKAVQMNMSVLAAISAPTTLAVEIAAEHNLTLAALAREKTFTIFTHGHRITG